MKGCCCEVLVFWSDCLRRPKLTLRPVFLRLGPIWRGVWVDTLHVLVGISVVAFDLESSDSLLNIEPIVINQQK